MDSDPRGGRGWDILAAAAGTLLQSGAIATHPLNLPVMLPLGDVGTTHWNFWWLDQCLRHGWNPYHTDLLYWPQGTSLVYHTLEMGYAVLLWPVRALLGGNAQLACSLLLATFLTMLATARLARELGARSVGAAAAAIAVGLHPYRTIEACHLNIFSTFFEPFALLCTLRIARGGRPVSLGIALGSCGALALLTSQFHALASGLCVAIVGAAALIPPENRRRVLGAAAVAALLCLPPILILAAAMHGAPAAPPIPLVGAERHSADLWQFLIPPSIRVWITGAQLDWAEAGLDPAFRVAVWYWPGLLLAGCAVHRCLRKGCRDVVTRSLVFTALVMAVLGLGPSLKADSPALIDPGASAIPLPAALLRVLPVFSTMRSFWHFAFVFTIIMAALGARSADELAAAISSRLSGQRRMAIAGAMVIALAYAGVVTPSLTSVPVPKPESADALSRLPEPFGLYVMPNESHLQRGFAMYEQTIHGHPLLGGYISRDREDYFDFVRGLGWTAELAAIYYGRSDQLSSSARADLASHRRLPLPVVVEVDFLSATEPRRALLRRELLMVPGARLLVDSGDRLVVSFVP